MKDIDDKIDLGNLLKILNERELNIIKMRYFEKCTYKEISEKYHISGTRVRQLENRAIYKIRKESQIKFRR
jgi:RNA polymerase sigma factor (sigma-70 family)